MKLPLIADNRGDVLLFESLAEAVSYIEPDDVKGGQYAVYDAEGRLIRATVERGKWGREHTVLEPAEDTPSHENELRAAVIHALIHTTKRAERELAQLSTQELVVLLKGAVTSRE